MGSRRMNIDNITEGEVNSPNGAINIPSSDESSEPESFVGFSTVLDAKQSMGRRPVKITEKFWKMIDGFEKDAVGVILRLVGSKSARPDFPCELIKYKCDESTILMIGTGWADFCRVCKFKPDSLVHFKLLHCGNWPTFEVEVSRL
ncbi:hypothetical protein ACFE04_002977 [Oxalis oulophora]